MAVLKMTREEYEAKYGMPAPVSPKKENYFKRVGQAFQQGGEEVVSGVKSASEAELPIQTVGRGALRTTGAVAKAAIAPVIEAPGIKQGLNLAGQGISKLSQIPQVQKLGESLSPITERLMQLAEKHPETKKDIEDIINIATLGGGKVVERPITNAVSKGAKNVVGGIDDGTRGAIQGVKNVTRDVIPESDRVVNYQVTRALDLTQGDITNISRSTSRAGTEGFEVGKKLAQENLIRSSKKETVQALKEWTQTYYDKVRELIKKADNQEVTPDLNASEIPGYQQALKELKRQTGEVPGMEGSAAEIDMLLKKPNPTRMDVQRVKELLDEHFSLYKVTGDVKESIAKEGLANIRNQLKEFLETEVKKATGEDISEFNRNVQFGKSTEDAISLRSTRGLTRSNIRMGDLGFFGFGTVAGGPLGGLAAVFAKKLIESPTVRLRIAKYLDSISDARKAKIEKELQSGKIPEDFKQFIKKKGKEER